jgi:hypothetical protein
MNCIVSKIVFYYLALVAASDQEVIIAVPGIEV